MLAPFTPRFPIDLIYLVSVIIVIKNGKKSCQKYAEFVDMVRNNAQFQPMLQALDEEI